MFPDKFLLVDSYDFYICVFMKTERENWIDKVKLANERNLNGLDDQYIIIGT